MKTTIKVIKRQQAADAEDAKEVPIEKSIERSTRETVITVKSWIAELKQRKRDMNHSFVPLPAVVTGRSR